LCVIIRKWAKEGHTVKIIKFDQLCDFMLKEGQPAYEIKNDDVEVLKCFIDPASTDDQCLQALFWEGVPPDVSKELKSNKTLTLHFSGTMPNGVVWDRIIEYGLDDIRRLRLKLL
jgi:hypothetical protein